MARISLAITAASLVLLSSASLEALAQSNRHNNIRRARTRSRLDIKEEPISEERVQQILFEKADEQ